MFKESRTGVHLFVSVNLVYPTSGDWNTKCSHRNVGFSRRLLYSCSICGRGVQRTIPLLAKMDSGTPQTPSNLYGIQRNNASREYLDQIWKNGATEDFSVVDEEIEEEEEANFLLEEDLLDFRALSKPQSTDSQRNPMEEWFSSSRDTFDPVGTIQEEASLPWVVTVMKAGEDRKAKDIIGLWVSELTTITSFLVNMCGNNEPQIQAIARNVEGSMWNIHKQKVKRRTGTAASGWILLDYGDIIVNIMSTSLRKRYNLEGLWSKAEKLTREQVQELEQSTV
ncbi:hypothetical protein GpartN1_g3982.t1 [Galdieria partita]|uniref:Ribosomal silencing factor RsfS n=1 Tax=Galdieria partita TaxID=83374 RepID=A0A9C7UQX8_9RHOD|nr:hypothetical protein GpartN1_g3982.t1 [Galdieria partita]